MSREQNAGQSHTMKIGNNFFEKWKSSDIWEHHHRHHYVHEELGVFLVP